VNRFSDYVDVEKVMLNNTVVKALHVAINKEEWERLYIQREYVYVHETEIVNTIRRRLAYAKDPDLVTLSTVYYPENSYEYKGNTVQLEDDSRILSTDSIRVAKRVEGSLVYFHNHEKEAKQYIKTHDDVYITKDTPYFVTTSKKKVVEGIHTFYTDIDGIVTIRRPKHSFRFLRQSYYSSDPLRLNKFGQKLHDEYICMHIDAGWNKNKVDIAVRALQTCGHYFYVNTPDIAWNELTNFMTRYLPVPCHHLKVILAEANAIDYNI
jgi:hypothetical protein